MKRMFIMLALVVAVNFTASAYGDGEKRKEFIPPLGLGPFGRLQINGLFQGNYKMSQEPNGDEKATWNNGRLYFDALSPSKRLEALVVINFAQLQEEMINDWLMLANMSWTISQATDIEEGGVLKLRLGRFFAAGGYTTPVAGLLETVSCPSSDPTGSFVNGLQVEYTSKSWLILADVSGKSDQAFDSRENWEHLEASARLQRNFGEDYASWVALTTQYSHESWKWAVDSRVQFQKNLYVRGALYGVLNDEKVSNQVSAYAIAVWEPVDRWELHAQIDWKDLLAKSWSEIEHGVNDDGSFWIDRVDYESSSDNDLSFTLGTRWFMDSRRTSTLTFDIVVPMADEKEEKEVAAEVRYSLKF